MRFDLLRKLNDGSGCFIRHARGVCAGLDPVAGIQAI
jgi:hypothetical protein